MNMENNIAIDIDFLRKAIGDDKNFEKELFEIFLETSKYNLSKLETAINSGDSNSWYMAAHALKGSSASIGAFNLSKVMEIAQKSADNNSESKTKMFEDIKSEFVKVEDFIKLSLSSS